MVKILKDICNTALDVISDKPDWWTTATLLGFFQPFYQSFKLDNALTMMGVSYSIVLFFVPTILGAALAVSRFKSSKRRAYMMATSILFNGYMLADILALLGVKETSLWYFLGGVAASYLFDFLFGLLDDLKLKGRKMVWKYLNIKVDNEKETTNARGNNGYPEEGEEEVGHAH
jgi:hypothetical protein